MMRWWGVLQWCAYQQIGAKGPWTGMQRDLLRGSPSISVPPSDVVPFSLLGHCLSDKMVQLPIIGCNQVQDRCGRVRNVDQCSCGSASIRKKKLFLVEKWLKNPLRLQRSPLLHGKRILFNCPKSFKWTGELSRRALATIGPESISEKNCSLVKKKEPWSIESDVDWFAKIPHIPIQTLFDKRIWKCIKFILAIGLENKCLKLANGE